MKIAILGTRGIPNNHGGFEQFAENFSVYLASRNHDVYVYNSHDHPYQDTNFKGVHVIHCYDPESKVGTVGQFIYDLNCILDSRKKDFDVILQLGYTSNSIWYQLLPKKAVIITNMDGMEWKRSKYSVKVQKFLKYAEKLAVRSSHFLISDSIGVKNYILEKYNRESKFIAYGATVFKSPHDGVLSKYNIEANKYCIIIARLEPENNIATIVEGFHKSDTPHSLLVFGALNDFGSKLQKEYAADKRIHFVGANYNQEELNNLRFYSRYYFHGHSVGGTNPSLLEAMASNTLIIANNNIFNKSILGAHAYYFDNSDDILNLMNKDTLFAEKEAYATKNTKKIEDLYSWDKINLAYEAYILKKIEM